MWIFVLRLKNLCNGLSVLQTSFCKSIFQMTFRTKNVDNLRIFVKGHSAKKKTYF